MKIAILDDYQDAVRPLDCFQKLHEQHVVISREHIRDPEVLAARLQGVEALVLIRERTPITEALLARLSDLRLIVQTGKRAPHLDLAACTRHGVAVVYATPPNPGRPYATAELTWGLILAAVRFIPQEVASVKAGHWQSTLGRALHGRTLGIFGYGNIGSLIATYGQAFGMRVLAWGREGSRARAQADGIEVAASRDALFRDADVLSLHLALTEETRGIVSSRDLAKMKSSALLVNTSRAALIEPGALEEALRAGRPGYAAVDVYESEPVADHPLHQDYPFFPHERQSMLAAIFHFDDAPLEKGCVCIVPGSHHLGPLEHLAEGGWHLPPEQYPLSSAVPCPARAGDVLFLSYLTIHGSGLNISNEARTTLLVQMRDPTDLPTQQVHQSRGQGMMLRGVDPIALPKGHEEL